MAMTAPSWTARPRRCGSTSAVTAQAVHAILLPYLGAIGLALVAFAAVAAFAWREGRKLREREGPTS